MKTKSVQTHNVRQWERTGRLVRPYVIDPVTITKYPLAKKPLSPDADSDDGRDFLLDPIHPHLLALTPGDPDSFLTFATQLGLRELSEWALDRDLPALLSLISRYETGYRHFARETVIGAWTDPHVAQTVAEEQTLLSEAFREALGHDEKAAARIVINHGWGHNAFQVDLDIDEADSIVYEKPHHIWSRAWFELLEGIGNNQLPRLCAYCRRPFIPRRSNVGYCTSICQESAYEQRRAKTEQRKKYQREYKRKQRSRQQEESSTDHDEKGDTNGID